MLSICKRQLSFSFSFPLFFSLSLYPYLPTPPPGQDMTHGQFLSGV